jgi:hypothetical protein
MDGGAGDDVLVVKSGVSLPVVLDGGDGDDCLQGGSGGDVLLGGDGDDVLIPGTGRPALDAGGGANRIVIPHRLGELRFASSADSGVLRQLNELYELKPLSEDSGVAAGKVPSPIIVGAADLGDERIRPMLLATYAAGQAVILARSTETDAARLRSLLGHPNSAVKGSKANKAELAADLKSPLIFVRKAPRSGTNAFDYRYGFFVSLPASLDDLTTGLLSQVFSATAILPAASTGSASNDLQTIATSYTSSVVNSDASGDVVQIANTVFDVRSFTNQADYYYFLQEMDFRNGLAAAQAVDGASTYIEPSGPGGVSPTTLIQSSPGTTSCTSSTTSSTTWSVGGSIGVNATQGLDGSISGGVSVTHSKTLTCPNTLITNMSNPATGQTQWNYAVSNPPAGNLVTFYNQWISEVPYDEYQTGQQDLVFVAGAIQNSGVDTAIQSAIPLPFGNTYALQKPQVLSVSPTCVNAGSTFTINGTGLYPSIVSSVLIDGSPLLSTQYTTASDTQINVVAPSQSGEALPVVVQTGEGVSNANVTIEISTFDLCGFGAVRK